MKVPCVLEGSDGGSARDLAMVPCVFEGVGGSGTVKKERGFTLHCTGPRQDKKKRKRPGQAEKQTDGKEKRRYEKVSRRYHQKKKK